MSTPLNQFDRIAIWYDRLAKLVFGKAIRSAQICFLHRLPHQGNVLILGGGTGWILDEIYSLRSELQVWYIEASGEMINLARKKNRVSRVYFIHGTENDIPANIKHDVIITNFYLDLFTEQDLDKIITRIVSSMNPEAIWLASDFYSEGKWWQKKMLALMYRFFKLTCKIKASALPNWTGILLRNGLRLIIEEKFYSGFIKSVFYRKSISDSIR
jgi:tRNA (cmo5U34)-methyltransferase